MGAAVATPATARESLFLIHMNQASTFRLAYLTSTHLFLLVSKVLGVGFWERAKHRTQRRVVTAQSQTANGGYVLVSSGHISSTLGEL